MVFLIALIAIAAVILRSMTAEERGRLNQTALGTVREVRAGAKQRRQECEPFYNALRARTPLAIVTQAFAALNVLMFVFLLSRAGVSGADAIVAAGGNFGPRTTNGEWWRLLSATFLQGGLLPLLLCTAVLLQVGAMLERLVGSITFAAVYIAAGVFTGLVSLTSRPVAVSAGASGAIFGLYGLLVASIAWAMLQRPRQSDRSELSTTGAIDQSQAASAYLNIEPLAVTRLAGAAIVFTLFNMFSDAVPFAAEIAGFVVGFVFGVVLSKGIGEQTAPSRRIGATVGVAAVVAIVCAFPLRGIADVRPEIAHVIAVEASTSSTYQTAYDRFRKENISAESLAQLIERTIIPELKAADSRLKALHGVPHEHQPLVVDAEEYVRLRSESWRLRADGLRKTHARPSDRYAGFDAKSRLRAEAQYRANQMTLGKAEGTERASLEVLERLKPAETQQQAK